MGAFCLISDAGDVTLWNPATRAVRTTFHFNVDQYLEESESKGYGFMCVCHDEAAADFRFVRLYSPPESNQPFEFDIYCLSTNVWSLDH